MVHTHRTTLLDLASPEAVQTYVKDVINDHRDATRKREAITYLQRIVEADKVLLKSYHEKHRRATKLMKTQCERTDLTSQANIQHILDGETRTVDQLMALLHVADGVLFGVDYTFDNTQFTIPNKPFKIRGDRAFFYGESNGQPATTGALQCTCVVKAPLEFEPLTNAGVSAIVVKGVEFVPQSEKDTVTFVGKTFDIEFENCIFDGKNHVGSQCIFGAGQHFEGNLTLKNCIIRNYNSWLLMDPTTASGTATTRMKWVILENCLFQDNKGSIAFRNVQNPMQNGYSTNDAFFKMTGCKFTVSGLTDVHEYFWSTVECNGFDDVTVTGNEAFCYQKDGGTRGFFQCWSRTSMINLSIENNKLTNFNYGYQIAMGDENATATFYGCPAVNADKYYIRMANGDLANVETPVSFVYPWDSQTAQVNLVAGALPTVTLPTTPNPNDLTAGAPPLIETFDFATETELENHVFQLGTHTSGYIIINNTALVDASVFAWFRITVHSDIIAQYPYKMWQDQIALPAGATWTIIEQERAFTSGDMIKRMHIDNQAGNAAADVPANSAYFFRLYFTIT